MRTASKLPALLVAVAAALLLTTTPAGASSSADAVAPGRPDPRIVDGTVAPPGSWPTVAALVQRSQSAVSSQFCGATVIDRSWVLTAAHCVRLPDWNPTAAQLDVLVGTQDLRTGGTRLPVAEIRIHSGWRPTASSPRNDVAVLRLATPVPAAVPLQALAAPDSSLGIVGAAAAGWGSTDPDGENYPPQLRQASMLTGPPENCAQSGAYDAATMVCAIGMGSEAGGPCFGDSGGPLTTGAPDARVQVGISSWVIVCGEYQTYFTKVATFRRWIDQQSAFGPHSTAAPFVTSLYRDLFGRAPTNTELFYAAASLDNGQKAPATYVAGLLDGPTYRGRAGGVARLYQAIFRRRPETGGMTYWMGEVTRGVSLKRIADQMVRAPEFTTLYGSLGNGEFVDRVYDNVLGRAPSADDRSFWVGELASGRRTRGQVMVGFSESAEYRTLTDPSTRVTAAFHGLLRRVPGDAELDRWRDAPSTDIAAFLLETYTYAARY